MLSPTAARRHLRHCENLPPLLAAACAALGAKPPPGGPLHKGGFCVLHIADGRLAAAEQHSLAGE